MSKRPPPPTDFDESAPLSDEEIDRARANPPELSVAAQIALRKPGRPALPASERKQPVSIRLSPEVLAKLRASGEGWQTRVDDILRIALGLQTAREIGQELSKTFTQGGINKSPKTGQTVFERMAAAAAQPGSASSKKLYSSKSGRFERRGSGASSGNGKKKA